MSDINEINIFRSLDFIRDNAEKYAAAKAQRIYLEEFRKTKKAILMQDAEIHGVKSSASQERDAYADPTYEAHLLAMKAAIEEEEKLRWLIEAARIKCEVWRTLNANQRLESKVLGG